MNQQNIQLVQEIYGKFGQGDIAGVLDAFHDDATWVNPGPAAEFPAYFGHHTGKAAIMGVFQFLGEHYDFTVFNPHTFLANDEKVVVLLRLEANVRPSGRPAAMDTVHVWTVRDGRIASFEDFQDAWQLREALSA